MFQTTNQFFLQCSTFWENPIFDRPTAESVKAIMNQKKHAAIGSVSSETSLGFFGYVWISVSDINSR